MYCLSKILVKVWGGLFEHVSCVLYFCCPSSLERANDLIKVKTDRWQIQLIGRRGVTTSPWVFFCPHQARLYQLLCNHLNRDGILGASFRLQCLLFMYDINRRISTCHDSFTRGVQLQPSFATSLWTPSMQFLSKRLKAHLCSEKLIPISFHFTSISCWTCCCGQFCKLFRCH